jgi:hypothetical protein
MEITGVLEWWKVTDDLKRNDTWRKTIQTEEAYENGNGQARDQDQERKPREERIAIGQGGNTLKMKVEEVKCREYNAIDSNEKSKERKVKPRGGSVTVVNETVKQNIWNTEVSIDNNLCNLLYFLS